jgi:hypothetical protein
MCVPVLWSDKFIVCLHALDKDVIANGTFKFFPLLKKLISSIIHIFCFWGIDERYPGSNIIHCELILTR